MRLTEKWRPRQLADVVGQSDVVRKLGGFIKSPYASCWCFKGAGGVGKSAVARLVAELLGCNHYIVMPATEIITREGAEKFVEGLAYSSLFDPWVVRIVEELSSIRSAEAKEVLKVGLSSENLPNRAIVLATSNDLKPIQKGMFESDSGTWLVQRFAVLNFSSNGQFSQRSQDRLKAIWKAETGGLGPETMPHGWQEWGFQNGDGVSFSMRVALDVMQGHLLEKGAMA